VEELPDYLKSPSLL